MELYDDELVVLEEGSDLDVHASLGCCYNVFTPLI